MMKTQFQDLQKDYVLMLKIEFFYKLILLINIGMLLKSL